jgi:hypothetical protein
MTSTANAWQGSEPTGRSYAGSRIEWHLYTEYTAPAGEPWASDDAPEHWLWLVVYGRNNDGTVITAEEVTAELTVADTGLTRTPDGWLDIGEEQVFARLSQIFPGAEVFFAPDGNDATISTDTDEIPIDPIFDLELRADQTTSPAQASSAENIVGLIQPSSRTLAGDRISSAPTTAHRRQPRRTTRRQRKGTRS